MSRTVDITNFMDYIMDYESGDIDIKHYYDLFQFLVDTGLAWTLQGSYGRTATMLINEGYISKRVGVYGK